MRVIAICFFAFLLGTAQGLYHRYVYEFGQEYGSTIVNVDGDILLLHPTTEKYIPVPDNFRVTYVRVTVDAISAPKVDFNADENKVIIRYEWTQLSLSHYSIVVKGVQVDV